MDLIAEDVYSYLRSLDGSTIRGLSCEGTNYQNLDFVIMNVVRRLERTRITLNRNELSRFNRKLSLLSAVYKDFPSFQSHMTFFRNHRTSLINKLSSSAYELEGNTFRTAIVKLLGYTVATISSLNLDRKLVEYIMKKAPFLCPSVRYLFITASFFGPICFIATFAEYLRSKHIVNNLINVIEEDKKLFEQVSNFHLEKHVMQFLSTEIFSQTSHQDIVKNVKNLSRNENLTNIERIFAAIVVSSMENDPLCIQDGRFLYKTYLFSRTEAAAIWHNRLSYYIDPAEKEKEIRALEDGLLHLKTIHLASCLPAETIIFLSMPLTFNRVVLSGLHGLCICSVIQKFRQANMCLFSNDLRKLKSDYQKVLEITRPPYLSVVNPLL